MRELSLFSGAGGGLLGTALLGWQPVGYVELNAYCQRVLAARIKDGQLGRAPIFTDVRVFIQSGAADMYRGIADVVSAGFPCQPFSIAGKQRGHEDERNMWPATREVISRVRPRSVLLENVPGLVSTGYVGTVLCDLARMGFVGRWGILGACDASAPHKRNRLWIVAHADCSQEKRQREIQRQPPWHLQRQPAGDGGAHRIQHGADTAQGSSHGRDDYAGISVERGALPQPGNGGGPNVVADANGVGQETERHVSRIRWLPQPVAWWRNGHGTPEPVLGGMADGLAHRLDRLGALGNGQVPAVVALAWRMLA